MSALASTTTLSANTITVAKGGKAVFIAPPPAADTGSSGLTAACSPSAGTLRGLDRRPEAQPARRGDGRHARRRRLLARGQGRRHLRLRRRQLLRLAARPQGGRVQHRRHRATADGGGYWIVAKDGGVFSFGDAKYYGSLPGLKVACPTSCGVTATPDGGGYWIVAKDGGIFAFGDATTTARCRGSRSACPTSSAWHHLRPARATGWWADGGIFAFGDAKYFGSLPASRSRCRIGRRGGHPDRQGLLDGRVRRRGLQLRRRQVLRLAAGAGHPRIQHRRHGGRPVTLVAPPLRGDMEPLGSCEMLRRASRGEHFTL